MNRGEATADLIARVRAATGPDREIDAAVLTELGFHSWAGRMSYPVGDGRWYDFGASDITASVDSALALVERVRPGTRLELIQSSDGTWWDAEILSIAQDVVVSTTDQGMPTLPLAIILALLLSLSP